MVFINDERATLNAPLGNNKTKNKLEAACGPKNLIRAINTNFIE
jgi:hypothetical protein